MQCTLKNYTTISIHFQGKPFNITVIQVYAQPLMLKNLKLNGSNDLQDLPKLIPDKCPFHQRRLECKSRKSRYTWLLLLLSRFSRVRLCVTPYMVAHQAPPSLGFSRQEHWSGLPLPSPWNAIKSFLELRLPLFSEWYSLLWPKSLLGNEVVAKSR